MTPAWKCPTHKDCPFSREDHYNWCGHQGVELTHQHWPKKKMGGKNPESKIVALLCWHCHDEVDNGWSLGNAVFNFADGTRHYLLWDVARGIEEPLIDRKLEAGSAAAVGDDVRVDRRTGSISAAAPPASGGDGVGRGKLRPQPVTVSRAEGVNGEPSPCPAPDNSAGKASESSRPFCPSISRSESHNSLPRPLPAPFSEDDWRQKGERLERAWRSLESADIGLRWETGDWLNDGVQHLSEEAYGHAFEIGFSDGVLRHCSWVAGKINPDTRVFPLKWTYYRHVAKEAPQKQKELLAEAQANDWSTARLWREIHGEPVTKKLRCPDCGHIAEAALFKLEAQ